MAQNGFLWCLLGMSKRRSHKWKSYVYCVSCNRPYLEAKKVVEEWDFARKTHKVVKKPSYGRNKYSEINYLCVNCGEQTWHNAVSLDKFKVASFVLIVVSAFLCLMAILTKEPLCWLLCCASILVTIYLSHTYRGLLKCKPIYDRWVRQHGRDPYNWPDATKPN